MSKPAPTADAIRGALTYVERDGIWHIVERDEDETAVTRCGLQIVNQTYLWQREPSPVYSRCKDG